MIRALHICLASILLNVSLALPSFAQVALSIYPPYAIAGKETQFVVSGRQFPTDLPAQLGLKIATQPASECENVRRWQVQTVDKYFVTCTVSEQFARPSLQIHVYNRISARQSQTLLRVNVAVLRAQPSLSSVSVQTGEAFPSPIILCENLNQCAILQGPLTGGARVTITVDGENLPPSLVIALEQCKPSEKRRGGLNRQQLECVMDANVSDRVLLMQVWDADPATGGQLLTERALVAGR